MLPRSDGVARYGAACVLVYLSVVALALLASATAQTVPLSGEYFLLQFCSMSDH